MQDDNHSANQSVNLSPRPRPNRNRNRGTRPVSQQIQRNSAIPRARPRSYAIEPSNNVFISYIPPNYTEAHLRELCSPYGEIVCSKIMINLETGQSKCFGFVKFRELSQARAAIEGINGMKIENKVLLAKYAQSHEREEKASSMLYIKRLPLSVTTTNVMSIFSRFGEILQVTPHSIDAVDPMYWRCFVQFANEETATRAMNEMNNKIICEGTRPIHVRYADETRLSGRFVVPQSRKSAEFSFSNEPNDFPLKFV